MPSFRQHLRGSGSKSGGRAAIVTLLFAFVVSLACELSVSDQRSAEQRDGGAVPEPSISSINGNTVDGALITISGTLFGRHSLEVEWTGGADGMIEALAANTLMRNVDDLWNESLGRWDETLSSGATRPEISNERAHSHDQAVKSWVDHNVPGSWQSGFDFFHPTRFGSVYATWWTYFEPISGSTPNCNGPQWKMFRIDDGPAKARVNDDPGNLGMSGNYYLPPAAGGCDVGRSQLRIGVTCANPRCWNPCDDYGCACNSWCTSGNPRVSMPAADEAFKWARWEVYAKRSDLDVQNGTFQLWVSVDGSPREQLADWVESICTHRDISNDSLVTPLITETPEPWQWLVWQNFWSNSATPAAANFFIDDVYLQFDTGKARVEIGDASVWEDCRQQEIQGIEAWENDSIQFKLNEGSFSSGSTVYVYVVRLDGRRSRGFPITLM